MTKKQIQGLAKTLEKEDFQFSLYFNAFKGFDVKFKAFDEFRFFNIPVKWWCRHGEDLGYFEGVNFKLRDKGFTLDALILPKFSNGCSSSGYWAEDFAGMVGELHTFDNGTTWDLRNFYRDVMREHIRVILENWAKWVEADNITEAKFIHFPDVVKCVILDNNKALRAKKWFDNICLYMEGRFDYLSTYTDRAVRHWAIDEKAHRWAEREFQRIKEEVEQLLLSKLEEAA